MNGNGTASGTVLFAQVNSFSYTNDALAQSLPAHLSDLDIEIYRIYPVIRKNPFLFALCTLAVCFYYGPKAALDRKTVTEKIIKTPFFFSLASFLIRKKAKTIGNLKAVFQTQGLFDASVDGVSLFIYTDNTILNRINKLTADSGKSPIVEQEKALYRNADFIAVSASHVVTSLVEDYGIAQSNVRNILIGANSPKPPELSDDRYKARKILFVGIDWERKGGPDLLAAFRNVAKKFPDASLTIVGAKPDTAGMPQVTALGKIPPSEVTRLMGEASIYCMPSHIEPSSVAVIEAATSGLPIVATASGGFLDSVKTGETGILVPPGDVPALTVALETLLADPELCARYGKAGQAWVEQFRWDVVSGKLASEITARLK